MKYKHFLKFNKAALEEGLVPEHILYVNGYDSVNDTVIVTNGANVTVTIRGEDLITKIVKDFNYNIENPDILKETCLIKNYRLDRKISVNFLSNRNSVYNDKYNVERKQPLIEDTLCIITAECWRPINGCDYVELFNEDIFGVFIEKEQKPDDAFKYIWSVIKNNVKNSWVRIYF